MNEWRMAVTAPGDDVVVSEGVVAFALRASGGNTHEGRGAASGYELSVPFGFVVLPNHLTEFFETRHESGLGTPEPLVIFPDELDGVHFVFLLSNTAAEFVVFSLRPSLPLPWVGHWRWCRCNILGFQWLLGHAYRLVLGSTRGSA